MAIAQRKFREVVFQMIFSEDFAGEMTIESIASLFDQLMVTKKNLKQAKERAQDVMNFVDQIDQFIATHSQDYNFKRISRVERNILRLGVFELLYDKSIPSKVAIAEAIRLSRKFGTPEGGAFVNAVLDAVLCSKKEILQPNTA